MNAQLNHIPGNRFTLDGQQYLYFGGTSYLAMQTLPAFREIQAQSIRDLGTHWGASRGGNLQLAIYQRAEKDLAAWANSPAACTLSSGFLAGRLVSEAFDGPAFRRFFSPNCHSALLPPHAVRFSSWNALKKALEAHLRKEKEQQAVVFTDTIGFDPGPNPVQAFLGELPRERVLLVADDSHGFGVLGEDGKGSYRQLRSLGFQELVVCGSLGKAMGVTAGAVLAEPARIAALMQHPVFLGASPAPPAAAASLSEGLEAGLYYKQFSRLAQSIASFQDRIGDFGLLYSLKDYPVITFNQPELAKFLLRRGIFITHFQYPAEAGTTSPSRIVLSAAHTPGDLEHLIAGLRDFNKSHHGR